MGLLGSYNAEQVAGVAKSCAKLEIYLLCHTNTNNAFHIDFQSELQLSALAFAVNRLFMSC